MPFARGRVGTVFGSQLALTTQTESLFGDRKPALLMLGVRNSDDESHKLLAQPAEARYLAGHSHRCTRLKIQVLGAMS